MMPSGVTTKISTLANGNPTPSGTNGIFSDPLDFDDDAVCVKRGEEGCALLLETDSPKSGSWGPGGPEFAFGKRRLRRDSTGAEPSHATIEESITSSSEASSACGRMDDAHVYLADDAAPGVGLLGGAGFGSMKLEELLFSLVLGAPPPLGPTVVIVEVPQPILGTMGGDTNFFLEKKIFSPTLVPNRDPKRKRGC